MKQICYDNDGNPKNKYGWCGVCNPEAKDGETGFCHEVTQRSGDYDNFDDPTKQPTIAQ